MVWVFTCQINSLKMLKLHLWRKSTKRLVLQLVATTLQHTFFTKHCVKYLVHMLSKKDRSFLHKCCVLTSLTSKKLHLKNFQKLRNLLIKKCVKLSLATNVVICLSPKLKLWEQWLSLAKNMAKKCA